MNRLILLWFMLSESLLSMSPEEKGERFIEFLDAQTRERLLRKELFPVFHNIVHEAFRDEDIELLKERPLFQKKIAKALALVTQQDMIKKEGVISIRDMGKVFVHMAEPSVEPIKPPIFQQTPRKYNKVSDIISAARREVASAKDESRSPKQRVQLPVFVPRS